MAWLNSEGRSAVSDMADARRHEEAGLRQLAMQAHGLLQGHPRVAIAAGEQDRQPGRSSSSGRGWRCARMSSRTATSSFRQAPWPWVGSWRRASLAAQAGSSRSSRSGSMRRRATLLRGSGSTPTAASTADRRRSGCRMAKASAVPGAHREAGHVEALQAQPVREGQQVVDEHRVAPALVGVPARPGMAAGVGQVEGEVLAQQGPLGGPVLHRRGGRGMQQDEGRPLALGPVGDAQAVGLQLRHANVARVRDGRWGGCASRSRWLACVAPMVARPRRYPHDP